MRVLHIYSGNLYGGVETLLVTLARHRDLCPSMEPHFAICFQGRLSEELAAVGAKIHFLGNVRVRQPLSVLSARRALRYVLSAQQIDIVICHSAWPQAIFGPVVRTACLPLVFWLHSAIDGRHWLERWASLTHPDLAICVNHFAAGTLRRMYKHVRAEVVYSPVSPPQMCHSSGDKLQVRADLYTPQNATVIIQASRMEIWKGQLIHLQGLSALRGLPDWVSWQVGGPQRPDELRYFKTLKEKATLLGIGNRVRFLGQRTDVGRLLAAADIYCQPNTHPEGTPLIFIEALHAGLPVVTTDVGGFKEILDCSCGTIVPPNDPQALAEGLQRLIENSDLRRRLGSNGPSQARKLCSPTIQMKKIDDLLNSILNQGKTDDCASVCL